jgi:hypothetical protein
MVTMLRDGELAVSNPELEEEVKKLREQYENQRRETIRWKIITTVLFLLSIIISLGQYFPL